MSAPTENRKNCTHGLQIEDCEVCREPERIGSSELVSSEWALRLVAKWCENRAAQKEDRRLLDRCRRAYKTGPLVNPVERFGDALEQEIEENTLRWRLLAEKLNDEADEAANDKLTDGGPVSTDCK